MLYEHLRTTTIVETENVYGARTNTRRAPYVVLRVYVHRTLIGFLDAFVEFLVMSKIWLRAEERDRSDLFLTTALMSKAARNYLEIFCTVFVQVIWTRLLQFITTELNNSTIIPTVIVCIPQWICQWFLQRLQMWVRVKVKGESDREATGRFSYELNRNFGNP